MKILLFVASIVIILTACNRPNKKLKEQLSNADSVAINYFKGDGTMDSVVDVRVITDKNMLGDIITFVSESSAKPGKNCGYDGSLHFFKNNAVVKDIDFRMNDSTCMFFKFKQDGQQAATTLSEDARRLLRMIRKYE